MKIRRSFIVPLLAIFPLLACATTRGAAPADAQEILKTVGPALDDLTNKTGTEGVYAVVEGKLLQLASPGAYASLTADDAKKANLLSPSPFFIVYQSKVKDHPPESGTVYGYNWRVMDVRPPIHVAFITQPVKDHPDMLLVFPKEPLKPGLFSVHIYDSDKGEYKFGVNTPDVEAFWREVVHDQPDSWHAHSYLGAMLYSRNDFDGALEQWKRCVELRPQVFETHNNYALVLGAKGRTDDALEQYKEAVAAHGNWLVRMNYANALQAAKHYDEAIRQYDAVQKLSPENAAAFSSQGACYAALEEWDVAAWCFQMALKIKPQDADARKNFDITLRKAKEAEDAFQDDWKNK